MPTPTPTMPRHAPRRGFLTMTRPMLAWCRIDECRRCCCRCWSGATSMEAVDTDASADHAKACAVPRVPDDADTGAGQVPHRWTPPMQLPIPMLARCRIEGRRRCSCRCRCWPCAASMDADDQDGTMTTLTINMRAAVFHLATLGFPRRLVFLPSTSPPETNRSALVAGSVKGGAGVRLPGFPVFCAPGYAPPSGGHSPALPPSSATGEERRVSTTRPEQ